MKPDQILIVNNDEWRLLKNQASQPIEPWSNLTGATLVIFHDAKEQTSLIESKGRVEYANALIEKEVRKGGGIEGSAKIFVHSVRGLDESIQAFYTALSLDTWSKLQEWAKKQSDHCILIHAASLLALSIDSNRGAVGEYTEAIQSDPEAASARTGKSSTDSRFGDSRISSFSGAAAGRSEGGKIIALRIDNEILALGTYQSKFYFSQTTLLGLDKEDIRPAVKALAQQFPFEDGNSVGNGGLTWIYYCSRSVELESYIANELAATLGVKFRLSKAGKFSADDASYFSSLNLFAESAIAKNNSLDRMVKTSWMSESWLKPMMGILVVALLAALAGGMYLEQRIAEKQAFIDQQKKLAQNWQTKVDAIAKEGAAISADKQLAFAAKYAEASLFEPSKMLENLRAAAGSKIRIQRVQLFAEETNAKKMYRVEGAVVDGANSEIANFIAAMRGYGWQATPIRTADASVGAFAYLLKPQSIQK